MDGNAIIFESLFGKLTLVVSNDDNWVKALYLKEEILGSCNFYNKPTPLMQRAIEELAAYFRGERHNFDLPFLFDGTPFQQKVWQALCTIPYGERWSYGRLAQVIGNPKAARAVGMANNKNKLPTLIPCHRVVGANGSLVGFASGIELKHTLLELETKYK